MKNLLFATTALAAATLTTAAASMDPEMRTARGNSVEIGGYYIFGWVSLDDGFKGEEDSSQTYGEGELYFDFEQTADNGLVYGVQSDLELVNGESHGESGTPKNTDEISIYVKGGFGELHFGHDDDAYDKFVTWAPTHDGSFGADEIPLEDMVTFINDNGTATVTDDSRVGTSLLWFGANDIDKEDAKVAYISPDFGGFRFGASIQDDDTSEDNPHSIGASYRTDLAGGSLRVTAANWTNNQDNDPASGSKKEIRSSYGVSYGFGPAELTAARATHENGETEAEVTEFGLGHKVSDALEFGVSRAEAEAEGGGVDEEGTFTSITGGYEIARGFETTLAYALFELENNTAPSMNNDGSQLNWRLEFRF